MNNIKTFAYLLLILVFLTIYTKAWKTDREQEDTVVRSARQKMFHQLVDKRRYGIDCIPHGDGCSLCLMDNVGSTCHCCSGSCVLNPRPRNKRPVDYPTLGPKDPGHACF
jgi:hypothetical protein